MARFVILALFAAIIISDAQTKPQIDETQDKLLSSSMRSILSTAKNFAVKAADNVVKVITKKFKDALDASQKVSQFLVENLKRFAYKFNWRLCWILSGWTGWNTRQSVNRSSDCAL